MGEIEIIIRPAQRSDKNFVFATWLKGQYFGSAYFRQIHQEIYYREYSKRIVKILQMPGIEAWIACDKVNPDWVAGFCVMHASDLYWVHVKKDFRERGIAKLLLKDKSVIKAKGSTKIGAAITKKKGLIFDPF